MSSEKLISRTEVLYNLWLSDPNFSGLCAAGWSEQDWDIMLTSTPLHQVIIARLVDWLKERGIKITSIEGINTTIDFIAPSQQIESVTCLEFFRRLGMPLVTSTLSETFRLARSQRLLKFGKNAIEELEQTAKLYLLLRQERPRLVPQAEWDALRSGG